MAKFLLTIIALLGGCNSALITVRQDSKKTPRSNYNANMKTDLETFYPYINHPYSYLVKSRVIVFGNTKDYATVVESVGYDPRKGACSSTLYYWGTCIKKESEAPFYSYANVTVIDIINGSELTRMQKGDDELVKDSVNEVMVNGNKVKIEHDIKKYYEKKIFNTYDFLPQTDIDFVMLCRYIQETEPNLMQVSIEQIKSRLNKDLPLIGIVNDWYYEDFNDPDHPLKFEESDVYRNIQKVIKTGNIKDWKNKTEANNYWWNWPDSGEL